MDCIYIVLFKSYDDDIIITSLAKQPIEATGKKSGLLRYMVITMMSPLQYIVVHIHNSLLKLCAVEYKNIKQH